MINGAGTAKICDFGISRIKEHTFLTTKKLDIGTAPYMAPECFSGCGTNEKCDIYSFGIILHECVTGLKPWVDCPHPFNVAYQVSCLNNRPPFPRSAQVPELVKKAYNILLA